MKSELEKFYNLADEIEIAMMTTRRRDGHLRSRAMANQKRADGSRPLVRDLRWVRQTARHGATILT